MKTKLALAISLLFFMVLFSACSDSAEESDNQGGDQDQTLEEDVESDAESASYPWDDTSLVAMTFNVMCSICSNDDGTSESWDQRVPYLGDIISRYAPDLIGLQELTYAEEVQEILDVAPGYSAVYAQDLPKNELGWTSYPDATILYREDRFSLEDSGVYWNSENADQAWAGGWQSGTGMWRLVVWARLKQVSDGREFIFATTHFDNNTPNQEKSALLALQRFESFVEDWPIIFVGDYNSKPDSPAYATLTEESSTQAFSFINAFDIAGIWDAVSNLDPTPDYNPDRRIDHIFLAGPTDWGCSWWKVDQTAYGEPLVYPSDHFPIVSELTW